MLRLHGPAARRSESAVRSRSVLHAVHTQIPPRISLQMPLLPMRGGATRAAAAAGRRQRDSRKDDEDQRWGRRGLDATSRERG